MPSTFDGMKHYTLLEAAKLLSTTDSTLRKKIKSGLMQAQCFNGLTYVTDGELYRLQDEKSSRKSSSGTHARR